MPSVKPRESRSDFVSQITWDCVYCGRSLLMFAIATQLVSVYDGIDYCRKCSSKAALERSGCPVERVKNANS